MRYHASMAMNLRLDPESEAALKRLAALTGRSQQSLIRSAIHEKLGLGPGSSPETAVEPGHEAAGVNRLAAHGIRAPRSSFTELGDLIRLGRDEASLDLLDREDRFE